MATNNSDLHTVEADLWQIVQRQYSAPLSEQNLGWGEAASEFNDIQPEIADRKTVE